MTGAMSQLNLLQTERLQAFLIGYLCRADLGSVVCEEGAVRLLL